MSELERRVDAIMARVPAQYRYRPWCHAPACACSGCVNGAGGVGGEMTASLVARGASAARAPSACGVGGCFGMIDAQAQIVDHLARSFGAVVSKGHFRRTN